MRFHLAFSINFCNFAVYLVEIHSKDNKTAGSGHPM